MTPLRDPVGCTYHASFPTAGPESTSPCRFALGNCGQQVLQTHPGARRTGEMVKSDPLTVRVTGEIRPQINLLREGPRDSQGQAVTPFPDARFHRLHLHVYTSVDTIMEAMALVKTMRQS